MEYECYRTSYPTMIRVASLLHDMCAEACRERIKKQDAKQFKALLDWHEEKRALELRISDLEAEIERLKEKYVYP